jgi:hypothetical protein
MVRSEPLDIRPRPELDGDRPAAGGLDGRVEQCRYYGHDALLEIRPEADEGEVLLARVISELAPRSSTRGASS